eukprot:TRINITY_DN8917_c0_g2_i1.p1 TRINITY_DN8917_c0_g2~~TRINITY_DN8917_c0_g2_i1.p1  ORF type:complete len:154 (-),score=36.91 TRINITY_DN8917_c0_g2_i1:26-487(-)
MVDRLKTAKRALDVGSGSGYLTLCMAKLMSDGVAYGVEHIPQLVASSKQYVAKNHADWLRLGKIVLVEGDGRLGLPAYAPYDVIHVGAACEKLPEELLHQLAPKGILIVPIGKPGYQEFTVIEKDETGRARARKELGVTYVPLTSKEKQLGYW